MLENIIKKLNERIKNKNDMINYQNKVNRRLEVEVQEIENIIDLIEWEQKLQNAKIENELIENGELIEND